MRIKKALLTIKGYCGKHISCGDCPLLDNENDLCVIHENMPIDWDVDRMLRTNKELTVKGY